MKESLIKSKKISEEGQAVVEYILMLAVSISIVAGISVSFRNAILALWSYYTQQITAACPTNCPPNPSYKFR